MAVYVVLTFVFFALLDWAVVAGARQTEPLDDDEKPHSGLLEE